MAITTCIVLLSLVATCMSNLNPFRPTGSPCYESRHLSQAALLPRHSDLNLSSTSPISLPLLSCGFVFYFQTDLLSSFPHSGYIVLLAGRTLIILVTKSLEKDWVSARSLIPLTLETQASSCGQSLLEKSEQSLVQTPNTSSKCKAGVLRSGPAIPLGLAPLKFPRQSRNRSRGSLIMACRASDTLIQTAQGLFGN